MQAKKEKKKKSGVEAREGDGKGGGYATTPMLIFSTPQPYLNMSLHAAYISYLLDVTRSIHLHSPGLEKILLESFML
jgi:hypothetical protein